MSGWVWGLLVYLAALAIALAFVRGCAVVSRDEEGGS